LAARNREIAEVWDKVSLILQRHSLPERAETALMDAAFGYRVTNKRYRSANQVSDVVASRDLKRLTEAGLLVAHGEKRGRYYLASTALREVRSAFRRPGQTPDPYELVRTGQPAPLPRQD
jgi:DNA-binding transcriptional ArsR family regulator